MTVQQDNFSFVTILDMISKATFEERDPEIYHAKGKVLPSKYFCSFTITTNFTNVNYTL